MLSLTRKADYAIAAMADLARRGATRASARDVARSTGVPLPVLTNILHRLLHHGLVDSAMGSKGGYRVAKPVELISLADLIDAIEGPFRLALCCETDRDCADDETCDLEPNCQIKDSIRWVHHSLQQFLGRVTLAQIAFNNIPIGLTVTGGQGKYADPPVAVVERRA